MVESRPDFITRKVYLEDKILHLVLAIPFAEIFGLQEDFEEHAELAKTLPESTSNENKLILYGLYKQATVGNVETCEYYVSSICTYCSSCLELAM